MPTDLQHLTQSEFKVLRKLLQKKYRELEKRFLVEGVHLVEEALDSNWRVEQVLVTDAFQQSKAFTQILGQARKRGAAVHAVGERELEQLSDSVTSQGILGVVNAREFSTEEIFSAKNPRSVIVALDSVGDPGNAGTILRTSDWFGADAVVLGKSSVELFNPKVVRSTMGAVFHLPIFRDADLREILPKAKQAGYTIISTAMDNAHALPVPSFPQKSVILFGSEAHGVSRELDRFSDMRLAIPRFGKAESLNVASACAIILALEKFSPHK